MLYTHSVTSYHTSPRVDVGTKRTEGVNEYTYVYTANDVNTYRAVVLASGSVTYTVTPTTPVLVASGNSAPAFGFNETGATVPASSYFWAQTKGYGYVEQTAISGCLSPVGLVVATTSGTVSAFAGNDSSKNHVVVGYSMAGLGTYTLNIPAFLDCK